MSTRLLMAFLGALLLGSMSPVANAQAPTENVLYAFQGGADGSRPPGGVIFDAAGNLYGTTSGGENAESTVFELSPAVGGGWTESVLHTFGSGNDGREPTGGLVFDAAGSLYGATSSGGTSGYGTVFELSPAVGGGWTESVLYNFFDPTHGCQPRGAVVLDSKGNLYGSTVAGGAHSGGTVFKLTRGANGTWNETTLHSFGAGDIPTATWSSTHPAIFMEPPLKAAFTGSVSFLS